LSALTGLPAWRPGSSQPSWPGALQLLVAQAERDRGQRLGHGQVAAADRDRDLAVVGHRDVGGAQPRDPRQRLGVEQQHRSGEAVARVDAAVLEQAAQDREPPLVGRDGSPAAR